MPRLRITVALGPRQQSFDLDDPFLDVGRRPDSMLVLPLEFVAETHFTLEDTAAGILLRPASPTTAVMLGGAPIPLAGTTLSPADPFELEIPAPLGAPLRLLASPLPAGFVVRHPPALPDALPSALLGALLSALPRALPHGLLSGSVTSAVPASPSLHHPISAEAPAVPAATRRHVPKKHFPSSVTIAAAVLLGAIALTTAIALYRPSPPKSPVAAKTDTQAEDLLNLAAMRFSLGNLPAARDALTAATQAGVTGPIVEALALALRNEESRLAAARPAAPIPPTAPIPPPTSQPATAPDTTPTTAPSTPPARPPSLTPGQLEQNRADAAARAQRDAQLRAALQQAETDAKASIDPKATEFGRAALTAAKSHVTDRLAPATLTFPDDADTRIVVVYANGTYTVRGFVDQWNQNRQPLRLFYLTKLRPTALNTFEHLSTDILQ